jgi:hypothetical protein
MFRRRRLSKSRREYERQRAPEFLVDYGFRAPIEGLANPK